MLKRWYWLSDTADHRSPLAATTYDPPPPPPPPPRYHPNVSSYTLSPRPIPHLVHLPLPPPTKASTPTSTHPRSTPHPTLYSNPCAMLLIVSFRFPAASDPGYWPTSRDICKLKKKHHTIVCLSLQGPPRVLSGLWLMTSMTLITKSLSCGVHPLTLISTMSISMSRSVHGHIHAWVVLCYVMLWFQAVWFHVDLISCWSDFMLIPFRITSLASRQLLYTVFVAIQHT